MKWDKHNKCAVGWSVGLLVLGLVCIGGSFGVYVLLESLLEAGVVDQAVVSGPDSPNYEMWVSNYDNETPPMYECYTFFNLTNADAVIQGSIPEYDEVGPWCYDYYRTKLNPTWSDDGDKVNYNMWQRFYFNEDESRGHTEDEIIVNINPNYLGVLAVAKSEFGLAAAFVGPAIFNNIRWLTGPYINHKLVDNTPALLVQQQNTIIADIQTQYNVSVSEANDMFLAFWANGTMPANQAAANFTGMSLTDLTNGSPSDISLATAQALFNATYELSLTNADSGSLSAWYNATNVWNGETGSVGISDILSAFELSDSQLNLILSWYTEAFGQIYVAPYLIAQQADLGVKELTDLGYSQWGQCADGKSVTKTYSDFPFHASPEYGCFPTPRLAGSLTVAQSKQLIVGPKGISVMLNVPAFLASFIYGKASGNWSVEEKIWGVPESEAKQFSEFYLACLEEFAVPDLKKVFAAGGGLVTAKSVNRWIFNTSDPLLAIADPSMMPLANLQVNMTQDDAVNYWASSTFYTGKKDISKVAWFSDWLGKSEIPAPLYAKPMPIAGTNDWGQFEPLLNKKDIKNFTVFDTHYIRQLDVVRTSERPVFRGITTYRYELSNETWALNPDTYQTIVGFCNISGVHNDTPIYASNPHWFGADPHWGERAKGVVENQNWETDVTVIDVEPWTGQTLHVNQSLQINLYIEQNSTQFDLFYPNITKDVMYPIAWVRDESVLSKQNADEYNDTVLLVIILKFSFFAGLIAAGIMMVVISGALGVHAHLRSKTMEESVDYSEPIINTNTEDYGGIRFS